MSLPLGICDRDHGHDWASLTLTEINEVLNFFSFKQAYEATLFESSRPFSAASLVLLKDGMRVFIKRHACALRPKEALQEEHDFLFFLYRENICVSPPMRSKNGETILSLNGATYEIFPSLKGEDLYQNIISWSPYLTQQHAGASGKELAIFHRKSSQYFAEERKKYLLLSAFTPFLEEDFLEALKTYILRMNPHGVDLYQWLDEKNYWDEMASYIGYFHKKIVPLMFHVKLSWGHGDWGGTNLSWSGEKIAQIFDFGMSNLMTRSFDIAIAIERSFVNWLDPFKKPAWYQKQLQEFLCAYHKEYPLSKEERQLIALFLPLTHVIFALSEIIYYQFLLKKEDDAFIVYHQYLIGHLKWFLSDDGKALLAYLEKWAMRPCPS